MANCVHKLRNSQCQGCGDCLEADFQTAMDLSEEEHEKLRIGIIGLSDIMKNKKHSLSPKDYLKDNKKEER